ncbi:MAG: NAD(P)H-binding protein, partial [Fibrobacter sp.]|nr:NAD(P)H-binding protein [Fibrobacter sp.]
MKNAVLVTGVRGTIGKELIKQLRLNNIDTRIAVRNPQKVFEMDTGGYPVVYFDYQKPDTFYSAFENIESVFLSVPLWCKRLDQLVLPSIQAAKQMGVKKIVTIGAIGVDLGTDTPLSIFEKC